jgi:dolichol-phosphate mannosyltransferase
MDADLQDPPELIPKLIEEWKDGAEVVHTTRTLRKGENPLKMLVTRLAYKLINLVADIDIPENTGDFKLLSRRAVNELVKLNEYSPFIRGLVRWVGFKQVQVSYERDARYAGDSHFPLWRSLSPVRELVRGLTAFSSLPLYFALFMGFLVSLGAFVYWAWIVIVKLTGAPSPTEGWGRIMASMLFLGGTILFTIGILGIYVGNIHQELKNRPHYVVSDKIGFERDEAT